MDEFDEESGDAYSVGHTGGKYCGGADAAKGVDIDGVAPYESHGAAETGTVPPVKGEGDRGAASDAGDEGRVSWDGGIGITNTCWGTALLGPGDALDCPSVVPVSTAGGAMDGVAAAASVFWSLFTLVKSLCSMNVCICLCIADN